MNRLLLLVIGDILIAGISVYAGLFLRFSVNEIFTGIDLWQLFLFITVTAMVSYLLELYNLEKQKHIII